MKCVSICNGRGTEDRKKGYGVITLDGDAVLEEADIRTCDMAVLCHTLAESRAMRLAVSLRAAHPRMQVLRIQRFSGDQLPGLPDAPADPAALLRAIEESLRAFREVASPTTKEALHLLPLRHNRASSHRRSRWLRQLSSRP